MTKKLKIIVLMLVCAQFFIPAALYLQLHISPGGRLIKYLDGIYLNGVTADTVAKPHFSFPSWLDGSFQHDAGIWFGQNFPARNLMVQINNQIDYSVYHKSMSNHEGIFLGKQGELYEKDYLDNYCNVEPAMPVDRMESIVQQMAELQARLAKRNIPFVLLVTPGKAVTYPEDIPDGYLAHRTGAPLNYDNFIPLLKRYNVNYVDGLSLVKQLRASENTPLFCPGSTHWDFYAAFRESQLLEDRLNRQMGGALAPVHYDGVRYTHDLASEDRDLADLLNVLHPPVDYEAPMPIFHVDPHPAPTKTMVVVGGSFNWKILKLLTQEKLFKQIQFYFYYHNDRSIYPDDPVRRPVDVSRLDWPREIFNANAIVLEINESTMYQGVNRHYTAFLHDALEHIDSDGRCH